MTRTLLTEEELHDGMNLVKAKLDYRKFQKGLGTMSSKHEVLGILEEELYEFKKAVHENNSSTELVDELLDIAIACIFGIASISAHKVDW